jgi:hypothetical protein
MSSRQDANRLLTSDDRVGLLHALVKGIVDEWADAGLFRSCLNCSYWEGQKTIPDANGPAHPEGCGKYFMTPPAKVIVAGCEDHTDLIPF